MWPEEETIVCSTKISPHTEHFLPSVSPGSVQVASISGIVSSVWDAGISFCVTSISPHSEHFLPSVRPDLVQVGSTAGMISSMCVCVFDSVSLSISADESLCSSPFSVLLSLFVSVFISVFVLVPSFASVLVSHAENANTSDKTIAKTQSNDNLIFILSSLAIIAQIKKCRPASRTTPCKKCDFLLCCDTIY